MIRGIVSQKPVVLDTTAEETRHIPPLEEVLMVAEKVTQTHIDGNIEHTDEYRKKVTVAA